MSELSLQDLNSMGVYQLREYARDKGVAKPTTKTKPVLIEEILKISKGELAPVKPSKKGRPPISKAKMSKTLFQNQDFSDFQGEEVEFFRFNSLPSIDEEPETICGYLRKTSAGEFYFRSKDYYDKIVSVDEKFVKEYDLVEGDKIEGLAIRVSNNSQYVLNDIISLNSKDKTKKRQLLGLEDVAYFENEIKNFENVFEGNKVISIYGNMQQGNKNMKDKLLLLQKEYKLVFLATNISTLTKLQLSKDFEGDLIFSHIDDNIQSNIEAVTNALNHVSLLTRMGEKVVFAIFDIVGVFNNLKKYFEISGKSNSDFEATKYVKKLFNLSLTLSNGGSCSVFANCVHFDKETNIFKNEIFKDADCVFEI